MKKTTGKFKDNLLGLLLPVIILFIWFMATERSAAPNYVLPSPKEFAIVFWDFIVGGIDASPYSGKMTENLIISAVRVGKGFFLAGVLGITLGFLTGRISFLKKFTDPTVQALRSVPGIGYLPLGMVWFGVGEENTLFLIALAAFFPVYLNTQEGAAKSAGNLSSSRKNAWGQQVYIIFYNNSSNVFRRYSCRFAVGAWNLMGISCFR